MTRPCLPDTPKRAKNRAAQRRYLERLRSEAPPAAPVDPSACDPAAILRMIAMDERKPAGPRVRAAEILLRIERDMAKPTEEPPVVDRVALRTAAILRRVK
jgi:hypothetical protein